jgi:hypothetical protein
MKTRKFLAAAILPLLLLTGCAKQPAITNVPAGVNIASVQAWGAAVDNFHLIETARHTADGVLRPLVLNKTLPVSVLQTMVKVDNYALAALDILDKSPENFNQSVAAQVTALASNILTEIAALNTPTPGLPDSASRQLAAIKVSAVKIQAMKGVK